MKILFLDDSFAFDGYTPRNDPMGGAQKGLVFLAEALAKRHHEVTVMNRCDGARTIRGVFWQSIADGEVPESDLVVALRHPRLLENVPSGQCRVLWVADQLDDSGAAALASRAGACRIDRIVFMGDHHVSSWSADEELAVVLRPGIAPAYLAPEPPQGYWPPRAVTTMHPRGGLSWLLDLWVDKIHPMIDEAELHVFSGLLARAASGQVVEGDLARLWRRIEGLGSAGVVVRRPLPDADMAGEFRHARVHLHPGSLREAYVATLAESQAAGCPGVAFKTGAAVERIKDSRSGFLVPDDAAFANCAILCLKEELVYRGRSKDAADLQRDRSWDDAAAELEALHNAVMSR